MRVKNFLCFVFIELLLAYPSAIAFAAAPNTSGIRSEEQTYLVGVGKSTPNQGVVLRLGDLADQPKWGFTEIVTRLEAPPYETFRISGRILVAEFDRLVVLPGQRAAFDTSVPGSSTSVSPGITVEGSLQVQGEESPGRNVVFTSMHSVVGDVSPEEIFTPTTESLGVPGRVFASRMVPQTGDYPLELKRVEVLIGPTGPAADFELLIWLDTGADVPGALLHSATVHLVPADDTLTVIDLPPGIFVTSGRVRVGVRHLTAAPPMVGTDIDGITPDRNFVRDPSGTWVPAENRGIEGDFVIRLRARHLDGLPAAPPTSTPAGPGTDPALILAEMMAAAIETRIQAEYDVYLKSDSWLQVPQPGDWAGLILNSPSRTFVENAVVEFAQRGIQIAGAEVGGVELRDIVVRSNWLGILCNDTSATIVGANVYGHVIDAEAVPLPGGINPSGTGLMCIGLAQPVISFSTFSNNEINGVGILGNAQPSFGEIDSSNSPGRNNFKRPRGQNYMFNGTPNDIYAQMNIWELLPGETVEDTIYDDTDDPAVGMIIWEPPLTGIRTGVDSAEWGTYR